YSHIEKEHLVKLLKQLIVGVAPSQCIVGRAAPCAANVPTLLGSGGRNKANPQVKPLPAYLRWPHMQADQVRGLSLREIGGGFSKHHRAPSIRFACYAIAKPSTMVQKMQNIKKLRGHRDAVYCAIFDRSGRYVITGSDDRLVKIWSMETAFCLASCRGHELYFLFYLCTLLVKKGDITDLAVSSNNVLVASASNDYTIRVWRLPDGLAMSVLRGHIGAVTAIAFSPRPTSVYQLLSSSDDGTCRIWDARYSLCSPRVYLPKPTDIAGKSNGPSFGSGLSSNTPQSNQILCCAYNANGTIFVTGSSDNSARVWSACKSDTEDSEQPTNEIDLLSGHENDVNYVQFSSCAVTSRSFTSESFTEEKVPKFRSARFSYDNIVTCSRDGSAIIWVPRSRKYHGKVGSWVRAYHLKVPPPPMPPQPPRGGPRQRLLPTPRGVNMIVWSLDNRFVLAAIMDNRICVWNASDGSLVHSLTGHTASTYVLDVHPFNPRIAMSAGYDGKTIVWDIWEGTPIRIYEIGRFKLVDGKFSPDGTSIVLSDDVGQIYLLNTGQGESQKDAEYDQFFLGDYRPLMQDAHGNAVDQETQLTPYRRNIQDALCDASMIPYPEPYQSKYQRLRLGALNIEWRPSSIKVAIGTDIGLGQEYQILPLADLNIVTEPLTEFIDPMYWELENDVINDDTGSDYNVTEEYSSDGELGSYISPSIDPECSEEDSRGIRRSSRKKFMAEVMTASGRRVKRRNTYMCDGSSSRSERRKRSRGDPKSFKRKAKSLRPQRVAARNSLTLFSGISEACTDEEDEACSQGDTSESESSLDSLSILENQIDDNWESALQQCSKGEDESESVVKPPGQLETQTDREKKRRLVLKFSLCNSKKSVPSESTGIQLDTNANLACSSSKSYEEAVELPSNHNKSKCIESEGFKRVEDDLETSEGYRDPKIRWGEVKVRTSKRIISGDLMPEIPCTTYCGNGKNSDDHGQSGNLLGNIPSGSGLQKSGDNLLSAVMDMGSASNQKHSMQEYKDSTGILPNITKHQLGDSTSGFSSNGNLNTENKSKYPEQKDNPTSKRTVLKIKSRFITGTNLTSVSPSCMKLEDSVYQSEMAYRSRRDAEDYCGEMGESTSNVSIHFNEAGNQLAEPVADVMCRTRSLRLKAPLHKTGDVSYKSKAREGHISVGTSKNAERSSKKAYSKLTSEERMSTSGMVMRSRSNVHNGDSNYNDDQHSSSGRQSQVAALRKRNWLLLSEQEEGHRYIPQQADEVVYLRQGHQEYLESSGASANGPWTFGKNIRAVEICLVEDLHYAPFLGSGESCCKMTLKFIDSSSSVFGRTFKLNLPEIDFADFVVERTRYDASILRIWACGEKCRIWWREHNEKGGCWYYGHVLSSKDKSNEFPGSPWDRYSVQYDDPEPHLHSPWELHDFSTHWEPPHIDVDTKNRMISSFAKLKKSASTIEDYYGVQKLNQVALKMEFLNRYPVPLYPELIELRLENNYYRTLEAVKHDIMVMLSNSKDYFANDA
ncbi:hypothetical protein RJ640_021744, partial [Escallonia rubra]